MKKREQMKRAWDVDTSAIVWVDGDKRHMTIEDAAVMTWWEE